MSDTDITRLLEQARGGAPEQLSAVFEAVYPELLRLANSRLFGNEATMTPTVLVHELFLRVTQGSPLSLTDRNHFFAISAQTMRWILVEHARRRAAEKHGGGQIMVSLDDQIPLAPVATTNVLALEECLQALEAINPQRRKIVELRYFAGLGFAEIASLLDCSERTVHREWERARAFLQAMLTEASDGS